MTTINSTALRRGGTAAVVAIGLAAAAPTGLSGADPASDATDFTLYLGSTYDTWQTVNGVTTETTGSFPSGDTGWGYSYSSESTASSGQTDIAQTEAFTLLNSSGAPLESVLDPFNVQFYAEPPV